MLGNRTRPDFICSHCKRLRALQLFCAQSIARYDARPFATNSPLRDQDGKPTQNGKADEEEVDGAMSRRLADMTERSMEEGGRSAKKAVEEAGFSEDLKKQLEERIAAGTFRSENASAFAQAEMPVSPALVIFYYSF